jgi:hypothetical protein
LVCDVDMAAGSWLEKVATVRVYAGRRQRRE